MENIHKQTGRLSWALKLVHGYNQFECRTEPACLFVCMFSTAQPCYSACGPGPMADWRGAQRRPTYYERKVGTCSESEIKGGTTKLGKTHTEREEKTDTLRARYKMMCRG